jgi:hypothetical protein
MKKVFISVGMRGREDEAVRKDIRRAMLKTIGKIGPNVRFVHNYDCVGPDDAGRTWYLGEAIKKLGDCDVCYFVKGWQNHKGCIAEMEICKLYGIEIIEEA